MEKPTTERCELCDKLYRSKWEEIRHNTRKTPCITMDEVKNKILELEDKVHKRQMVIHRLNRKVTDLSKLESLSGSSSSNDLSSLVKECDEGVMKSVFARIKENRKSFYQNIEIRSFGKESLKMLTQDDVVLCFQDSFKAVWTLTKKIHFNKDYPGNVNVLYFDRDTLGYGLIYENDEWRIKSKEVIQEMVYHKNCRLIYKLIEKYKNQVPDDYIEKIEYFQTNYQDLDFNKEYLKNQFSGLKMMIRDVSIRFISKYWDVASLEKKLNKSSEQGNFITK